MRKLWIAALAVVGVMAMAGVAVAANTYKVHVGSSSPGKGSMKKPVPSFFKFGFRVADTEGLRPYVIKQYRIAAEGLRSYPASRPKCTFAQATDPLVTDPSDLSAACKRAIVGSGFIHNEIGASNDRSQKAPCDVKMTLMNLKNGDNRPEFRSTVKQIKRRGGIAIRIDTDPPACLAPVHEALAAPFYDTKIDGIPTTELRFGVPDTLRHPGGVLDNSIIETVATIQKKTGRVPVASGVPQAAATRRVGFYSLVGRKGAKRTVRVVFVDESNAKRTAKMQFPK